MSYDIPYIWNLKRNDTSRFIKQRLTDLENELMVAEGKEIVRNFGKVMYTLLYLKWIINKDLMYGTWNSAQCYMAAWMGEGLGENGYVYIYG